MTINKYILLAVLFWAFGCVSNAWADHASEHHRISPQEKIQIIEERLNFYNSLSPDIFFTYADGGEDWHQDMLAIITMLGEDATNLDYQHPPELASELMEVNIERLAQMLEHNIVSAALFKVGKGSLVSKPNMCLITINPETYISDNLDAMRNMLDLNEELLSKVHPSRLLDSYEHLRFTMDHEAFHCLDSYIIGGAPMTDELLGGEYNLFMRESGADAFALGMHIHNREKLSHYARNITHVRALWLFTESPNRCTYDSMMPIYHMSPESISNMNVNEIFKLAVNIRNKQVGDYPFYLKQRAAAFRAALQLGHEPTLYGKHWIDIEKVSVEQKQVEYKVNRYRYYFSQLFTADDIHFTPADLPE